MFAGVTSFLAGMFSSSRLQDTAVDAIRKVGGLDEMTSQEKAKWLLDYINVTKHQSPMRRLIALALTIAYIIMLLAWIIAAGLGYYLDYTASLEFAGAVKMFMEGTVVQPFNIILAFYFVTHIVQKVGK